LGLAPSPEGRNVSFGEFAKIQEDLHLLPRDASFSRRLDSNSPQAEHDAKDWFVANSGQFRESFEQLKVEKDFETWLSHEVDFIWEDHTKSQHGLFNPKLIPNLALLLSRDEKELTELHHLSGHWPEVQRLTRIREANPQYELLSDAYAGAFLLRGIYHDNVAVLNAHTIMPHRLRRIRGFLPERTEAITSFEQNQTVPLLADLILQCARKEKSIDRSVAYSKYISNARQKLDSLDLSPKSRFENAADAAADAAVVIGLHTQSKKLYELLDIGVALLGTVSPAIVFQRFLGFSESVVPDLAVAIGMWALSKEKNIGLRLGTKVWDTESRFEAMLAGPPGRLGGYWN
jgi:hypothetical protein